jgi:hypothetical protein
MLLGVHKLGTDFALTFKGEHSTVGNAASCMTFNRDQRSCRSRLVQLQLSLSHPPFPDSHQKH